MPAKLATIFPNSQGRPKPQYFITVWWKNPGRNPARNEGWEGSAHSDSTLLCPFALSALGLPFSPTGIWRALVMQWLRAVWAGTIYFPDAQAVPICAFMLRCGMKHALPGACRVLGEASPPWQSRALP